MQHHPQKEQPKEPKRATNKRQETKEAKTQPRAKRAKKDPPLFEGENHGILWVPGSGFERGNYIGPGTHLLERLKRGDQGKTAIDKISKLHDIDYTLASGTARDQADLGNKGREADERMIRNGWKAYMSGNENLFNFVEGAGLIKAKTLLEDWGLIDKTKFLSPRTFKYLSGAENRDASEYEILLRARQELVCEQGPTVDEDDCKKTTDTLNAL